MRGRPSCHRLDLTVFWKSRQKIFIKTENLYQVPKLRNTTTITDTTNPTTSTTTTITTTTTTTTWSSGGVPGGGPRENPSSLSSPRAWKLDFQNLGFLDRPTDQPILSAGRV